MSRMVKNVCRCIPIIALIAAAFTAWAEPVKQPLITEKPDAGMGAPATPALGKTLFTGEKRFTQGAAACGACHALANRGITGGNMATDLGGMFTPDSADSIKEAISAIEAPVMKKIYSAHPLTDGEYAALAAFARQPLPEKQPEKGPSLHLAGMGVGALLLLGLILYKRRIR